MQTDRAWAGNEANFVLYDHHTDEKGETEVNLFGDFSNAVGDEPRYSAQLFEIERALTAFAQRRDDRVPVRRAVLQHPHEQQLEAALHLVARHT